MTEFEKQVLIRLNDLLVGQSILSGGMEHLIEDVKALNNKMDRFIEEMKAEHKITRTVIGELHE